MNLKFFFCHDQCVVDGIGQQIVLVNPKLTRIIHVRANCVDYVFWVKSTCTGDLHTSSWNHRFFGHDFFCFFNYALASSSQNASCNSSMKLKKAIGWANNCVSGFSGNITFTYCYYYIGVRNLKFSKSVGLINFRFKMAAEVRLHKSIVHTLHFWLI